MPIYRYRCRGCGEIFDLLEGVSAEKTRRICPHCSSRSLEKVHAAFNVGTAAKSRNHEAACPTCPAGPVGCAGDSCPF